MAIKEIRVANFKSFEDMKVTLGNLNILIGANASGKSNFIQIFKFLRDIRSFGLENAISLQGGVEYLRNISIGSSKAFSMEIISDWKIGLLGKDMEGKPIGVKIDETYYKFALEFVRRKPGFKIVEDKLSHRCNFVKLERQKKKFKELEEIGSGEIAISNSNGRTSVELTPPGSLQIKRENLISPLLPERISAGILLLEVPFLFPLERAVFDDISIYDFDPRLPKKAIPITGKAELEEDGSNLAIVLKSIMESDNERRRFLDLVKYLLPFVADLDVERFADKSLLFKLREEYSERHYLPASLISDGTINLIALIIALYFEKKPLIIIEEPERNIHPRLISRVVNIMKDASQNNQIIVTTHNPEIIRHADIEDILLVSRGENGFSSIFRPAEKEKIKIFLENEMGISELYVDNLLEI